MTHSLKGKLVLCSLVAAMTVTTTAPGFAAERAAPAPARPTLLSQAQKQVQQIAKVTRPKAARSAQEGQGGGYDEPGTFFKTKRGVALLVLAAAGVGYMTYSAFNDRIHSEKREELN